MASPDDLLLDHAALRQRGVGLLQRLAGRTWTDHNTHDPGITLLETLCYVLTDLGYRTAFPVQDLLADHGAGRAGVFTAAQVLPGGPVTIDDLRRLVIDLPGVKNAWVERLDAPLARHDAAQGLLTVAAPAADGAGAPSPNVTDLRPRGLYRVRIEKSGLGEDIDGGTLMRLAAERLQHWRGLGEDVADIAVLDRQPVALDAVLEIAAGADAADLLAAAYAAVADHLSPALPLHGLRELLERGWRVDQIFEGPLLSRGFLDPAEWAAVERRRTVRLSDLIQVLMAVPGVVAVKSLGFYRDGQVSRDWLLPIADDRSAAFDIDGSRLRLERRGLRVDHDAMRAAARRTVEARARLAARGVAGGERDLPAPAGRPRQVGRYLSLLHHLPTAYGVGPAGLSSAEPVERLARAQQLKAYLLVFDQLLANQFAQLGQAGRLLAFDDDSAAATFAQAVPDEGGALQLDALRRQPLPDHEALLARLADDPWGDGSGSDAGLARRHRLLDHLLARLGERWGEHRQAAAGADGDAMPATAQARALRDKQAFLRDYPRQALRRGVGVDALAEAEGAEPAGLALRLARLLGLDEATERFWLVEHIQLRPLPGDLHQQGPWLRGVAARDPFSLQLTLVLPAQGGRLADPDLRQRLLQTVRDEAPAHLALRLLWLDDAALADFTEAHARWRALWRQALRGRFGLAEGTAAATGAPGDDDHQRALRSARNRVIDALDLGDSFPLTDLVVADGGAGGPIKVAHGRSAHISIDDAEAGVRYTLRGPDGQPLKDAQGQALPPVAVDGNGGRVVIESPPVTDDITFRILATKLRPAAGLPAQPPVLLAQAAAVKVGLDTRLAVELPDLPLLDTTLANPQPGDVRLAAFGDRTRVLVHQSQEGVAYALVVDGAVQADTVVGDLGTIELRTPPLREDCALAVQATKRFGASAGGQAEQQLLDTRLQLAVRADPALALRPQPGPVLAFAQAGAALRVAGSQASASYRVYARRVRDAEWLRDLPDGAAGVLRAAAGRPAVAAPQRPDAAQLPPGFQPLGAAPLPGNGGDLDLPLDAPVADAVYLVQATKQHAAGNGATVASEVGLAQAVLVLTQPDTAPRLQLTLLQGAVPGAAPELRVDGGQPGVFYAFGVAPDGPALPLPAYVHQRDDQDGGVNKGLGQLAVGIDLVVAGEPAATDPLPAADGPPARDRLPPQPPTLALPTAPALPADAVLAVRAVKAQTGVETPLAAAVRLQPLPKVAIEPPALAAGQSAQVRVAASLASERYQLRRRGRPLASPVPGNGGDLLLDTGPVADDAVFQLVASPAKPASPGEGLPLQRAVALALWLLPRTDLALAARRPSLAAGEGTDVVVTASQPGVRYQLLALAAGATGDPRPVGDAVPGTGADLALPTGALAADTRFTVRATRLIDTPASALLAGEVLVAVVPAV